MPSTRTRVLSFSTSSSVGPTPTSAASRVSSISSHAASSSDARPSTASSPLPSVPWERASRARRRTRRPFGASGRSSVGGRFRLGLRLWFGSRLGFWLWFGSRLGLRLQAVGSAWAPVGLGLTWVRAGFGVGGSIWVSGGAGSSATTAAITSRTTADNDKSSNKRSGQSQRGHTVILCRVRPWSVFGSNVGGSAGAGLRRREKAG